MQHGYRTSGTAIATYRATIITAAPVVLLASFVYHPHITFLPDATAVAHAVQADTLRWAIAHLGIGVASAIMAVAYVAVRGWLQDAGEDRWSAVALPLLVLGAALYAILPGMEFTVLAAAQTGSDIVSSQKAIDGWFVPTMMTAALFNGLGLLALARAVRRSAVAPAVKSVVVPALCVMAVARFVPVGPVQFHVQGMAGVVALLPIAYDIVRGLSARRVAQSRPMPAT